MYMSIYIYYLKFRSAYPPGMGRMLHILLCHYGWMRIPTGSSRRLQMCRVRVFHLKRRVRNAESFFEKTIHAIDKAVGVHGAVFRIDTDVAG